jgi:hypothetical protein
MVFLNPSLQEQYLKIGHYYFDYLPGSSFTIIPSFLP